jgi:hypothetical protein
MPHGNIRLQNAGASLDSDKCIADRISWRLMSVEMQWALVAPNLVIRRQVRLKITTIEGEVRLKNSG